MRSRCMSLLPRAVLHSDSEHFRLLVSYLGSLFFVCVLTNKDMRIFIQRRPFLHKFYKSFHTGEYFAAWALWCYLHSSLLCFLLITGPVHLKMTSYQGMFAWMKPFISWYFPLRNLSYDGFLSCMSPRYRRIIFFIGPFLSCREVFPYEPLLIILAFPAQILSHNGVLFNMSP